MSPRSQTAGPDARADVSSTAERVLTHSKPRSVDRMCGRAVVESLLARCGSVAARSPSSGPHLEVTDDDSSFGLDNLVTTLEMDCGLTADGVPVMYHDRDFQGALPGEPRKSRRKLGDALPIHIKDVTLASIQDPRDPILNDGIIRDPAIQSNDPALSPVSVAFWAARGRTTGDIYMMASLDDVFAFVDFYVDYYKNGPGKTDPRATLRWKNAAR